MKPNGIQALWVALAAVLAFFFVRAGIEKFLGVPAALMPFEEFGWPVWTVYLTALAEFAGSIALFIPVARTLGGLLLAGVMAGAAFTNIVNGDISYLWTNILLGAGSLVLAWQGLRYLPGKFSRTRGPAH